MRGSPLLRLALVIAGMLALLAPLRSLTTQRAAGAGPAPPGGEEAHQAVRIALASTKVPFQFQMESLGRTVWAGEARDGEVWREVPMSFPEEGVDLVVSGSWRESGPAAVKITVTPGGREPVTKMLWGDGSVSDVLTFRSPPP